MSIVKGKFSQTEAAILFALFKATVEQSEFFNEAFNKTDKALFKNWKNSGYRIIKVFEDNISLEFADALSGTIHDVIHEIRKTLNNKYEEQIQGHHETTL